MIFVRDFPRGEVSVKVGVMEFGLNRVDWIKIGQTTVLR